MKDLFEEVPDPREERLLRALWAYEVEPATGRKTWRSPCGVGKLSLEEGLAHLERTRECRDC